MSVFLKDPGLNPSVTCNFRRDTRGTNYSELGISLRGHCKVDAWKVR